ncbi:hypothetical protein FIM12_06215 [SAR202 cluster bacterium AD-804-J14_MRT_500m]|nr:hypothetical protein [SAR202 cluster bacterium AD-804-J14_MRT_500m]
MNISNQVAITLEYAHMHIVALTPSFTGTSSPIFVDFGIEPIKVLHATRTQACNPLLILGKACGVFISSDPHTSTHEFTPWHKVHLQLINYALEKDLPILASGSGMQLINQAFGGQEPKSIPGHTLEETDKILKPTTHTIYLSPGSKSAAVLGVGGFFKVNSNHRYGIGEIERSPDLLASAYSVEDGIVEGLESTQHSWVIGFQTNLEVLEGSPTIFKNLFLGFIDRAKATQIAQ